MTRDIKDAVPTLQEAWLFTVAEYNRLYPNDPKPFLTCVYRTNEEQAELYAIGRTKPGRKVTNCTAGKSKHNLLPSHAFDIAFIGVNKKLDWNKALFRKFADIIKQKGVTCGIDWKFFDPPHFEV